MFSVDKFIQEHLFVPLVVGLPAVMFLFGVERVILHPDLRGGVAHAKINIAIFCVVAAFLSFWGWYRDHSRRKLMYSWVVGSVISAAVVLLVYGVWFFFFLLIVPGCGENMSGVQLDAWDHLFCRLGMVF